MGIALDIWNNITDNAQFQHELNYVDPVLLQSLCMKSGGELLCIDLKDPTSLERANQMCCSFFRGEYGFDVGAGYSCDVVRVSVALVRRFDHLGS